MKPFAPAKLKRVQPHLGTFIEITLNAAAETQTAFEAGFAAIARVHGLMSFYDAASDLSRLNSARVGEWVELDSLTAAVLHAARELEEASAGIFNVATGSRHGDCFEVAGTRALRTCESKLDLGGLAKGFAVDLAVEAIMHEAPGISGIVNAGGDLRVFGAESRVIELRAETAQGPVLRSVSSTNLSVATSSVRRSLEPSRQFSANHFLRGRPFISGMTVSVFARECIRADALTKILLMGEPAVAQSCLKRFGAEALVFDLDGRPIEAA